MPDLVDRDAEEIYLVPLNAVGRIEIEAEGIAECDRGIGTRAEAGIAERPQHRGVDIEILVIGAVVIVINARGGADRGGRAVCGDPVVDEGQTAIGIERAQIRHRNMVQIAVPGGGELLIDAGDSNDLAGRTGRCEHIGAKPTIADLDVDRGVAGQHRFPIIGSDLKVFARCRIGEITSNVDQVQR